MITAKQIGNTDTKISNLVKNMIENSDNSVLNPHNIQKLIGESNRSLVKLTCDNLVEKGMLFNRGSAYSPNPNYRF